MASKLARLRARLPTYWTYIRERPTWLVVLLLGRILPVRSVERKLIGGSIRAIAMPPTTRLHVSEPDKIISDLKVDGVSTRFRLAERDVEEIYAFAIATRCKTRIPPIQSFLPLEFEIANQARHHDVLAAYYFSEVERCPVIGALERDPMMLEVANAFIGGTPYHIRTRLWWSFPGKRICDEDLHATAQDRYHFDLNGFRTLKFFYYVTDVDQNTGPHTFIAGSHVHRKARHQYTFMVGHDEEDLRKIYPNQHFRTVTGPAGTGFAEDPFIFHAGRVCRDKARLLLEIEYGPRPASPSYRYGELG